MKFRKNRTLCHVVLAYILALLAGNLAAARGGLPTTEELDRMLEEKLHFDERGNLKPERQVTRAARFELDTIFGSQIRRIDLTEPSFILTTDPEVGIRWIVAKPFGNSIRFGPQVTSSTLGVGVGFRLVPVAQITIGPAVVWDPDDRAVRIGVYGGVLKF